jgi:hypothetical protein
VQKGKRHVHGACLHDWGHDLYRRWGSYSKRTGTPYSNEDVAAFCQTLQGSFPLLTDLPLLTGIVRDPNDDMVLATARAAHATYLITRDLDLLSLQTYEGITILTPEAFMAVLRERGRLNP